MKIRKRSARARLSGRRRRFIAGLRELQAEHHRWAKKNFDNRKPYQPILGAAEEIGELSHAYLKMEQGIRGERDKHLDAMRDAVADCTIFLIDFCGQMGWDFSEILCRTWDRVRQRNWKRDRMQDTPPVQEGV